MILVILQSSVRQQFWTRLHQCRDNAVTPDRISKTKFMVGASEPKRSLQGVFWEIQTWYSKVGIYEGYHGNIMGISRDIYI